MKGATTEPCVKTIKVPINRIVIINGANQYFFLVLRKSHTSFTNSKKASIFKIISKILLASFTFLYDSRSSFYPRGFITKNFQ